LVTVELDAVRSIKIKIEQRQRDKVMEQRERDEERENKDREIK